MMTNSRRYLAKAIGFLLSIMVIAHVTVAQGFYLSRSHSGKPWAALTAWLELRAWFSHEPQAPKHEVQVPAVISSITENKKNASFRIAQADGLR